MSLKTTLTIVESQTQAHTTLNRARLFYTGAALILLLLMLIGFQQFFLHGKAYPGREIAPQIRTLIILHGLTMSAWIFLFLIQPLLIVSRNHRIHRMLGKIGAALAACIFVLGLRAGIEATRIAPPDMVIWGLTPKQFMAVPIISIVVFVGFVAVGVWNRRRPEVHRPMLLLATLAAMPAAISRIESVSALYRGTVWETFLGPPFGMLVVGALFLFIKWLLTRSADRWYATGYAVLALISVLIMRIARTDVWDQFASFLLR
ncbi:hypothetical protein [Methylomicrobium sp. Wu6]|uniref:hypothetical protein n=1 Tax=Methylomicrobium sp. Wu6 TaxID=3107928 RepID=UPI002DD654D1|nr:hypothetical protein [Methylomicrobium sp. Wu6]MEC4749794.1 hypothetical protein [Methylomicrobium sp. Wu6]